MTKLKDISNLLSDDERKAFNDAKIKTTDELWRQLADNYEEGMQALLMREPLNQAKLSKGRVLEILAEILVHEQDKGPRSWFARHIVEILGILLAFVVCVLALRACGWLEAIPAPIGLKQNVVVAARDLIKGSVIGTDDVTLARVAPSVDYYTSATDVQDLILASDAQRGKPLSRQNLLAPQVVASSNILTGSLIAETQVTITWSPDISLTLKNMREVIGLEATRNIKAGQGIRPSYVQSPPMVEQVVARFDLSALQPLTNTDLELGQGSPQPGTFTTTKQLVGKVLLQAVPRKSVLKAEQVIDGAELQGRTVLAIPTKGGSIPILKASTKVTLLFSARASSTDQIPSPTNTVLSPMEDVLVLSAAPSGDPTAVVVAIIEKDVERLNTLLSVADIYIARRFP